MKYEFSISCCADNSLQADMKLKTVIFETSHFFQFCSKYQLKKSFVIFFWVKRARFCNLFKVLVKLTFSGIYLVSILFNLITWKLLPEVVWKKRCSYKFHIIEGKHLWWSLYFPCEVCEIRKNTCFTEHLWTTVSKLIRYINLLLF